MNAASLSADRISALLAAPHEVTGADLEGLRVWRDRFPYATGLDILVAKAAAEAGSVDQQAELLRAAANASSREGLFHLFVRPRLVEEAIAFADEVEQAEDEVVEAVDEEAEATPDEVVKAPVDEEVGIPDEVAPPTDDVQREVLLAAIESSIEQDVREWEGEQRPPAPAVQGRSSYSQWLAARARGTGFGTDTPAPAPAPKGQDQLIDAFIAANPRIGRLREVDGAVEDLARQSVLEDATLVTETMARVYAKQGQIGKARKAYKLLALKYPAKSTYFAAQLKQLGNSSSSSDA